MNACSAFNGDLKAVFLIAHYSPISLIDCGACACLDTSRACLIQSQVLALTSVFSETDFYLKVGAMTLARVLVITREIFPVVKLPFTTVV